MFNFEFDYKMTFQFLHMVSENKFLILYLDKYGMYMKHSHTSLTEKWQYALLCNLMFLWSCIMNWPYNNYQRDALNIIYS